MNRRSIILSFLVVTLALPLSASTFVEVSFDDIARDSALVVRARIGAVQSAWDENREVIFSTATLAVSHYFAGEGPRTLIVREVGGTVGDYTQAAIGFPTLREGQEVVLFLTAWENGDWRINHYAKGKYLVVERGEATMLRIDPVTQGHERARFGGNEPHDLGISHDELTLEELAAMVNAARAYGRTDFETRRK